MARNEKWHQEIHSRVYQVSTEQSAIYEESRRIPFIGSTGRTIAEN